MVNSIVADGFSRIKNAQSSKNLDTTIFFSKFMFDVVVLLRNEGYIRGFSVDGGKIRIFLKYLDKNPTFKNIYLVSKPSRRVFCSVNNLIKKSTQTGTFIISTPIGLLSLKDAVRQNVGGELICRIV